MESSAAVFAYEHIEKAANYLESRTKHRPTVGVICGSGWKLAESLTDVNSFNYKDIPHFPISSVHGHVGQLLFGMLSSKCVVLMNGRVHGYEGQPAWKITLPVRVMKLLGVKTLIVTNASGGLNPSYRVGDAMIIKDHIDLPGMAGKGPLVGLADPRFGERFISMSNAYDERLREAAKKAAVSLGVDGVREGVYAMLSGPAFETVAESNMLRMMGADAVGMSTAPEVVVAVQCGLKCLGISLISDMCAMNYEGEKSASHEEVLEAVRKRSQNMLEFVSKILENIDQ